MEADVVKTGFTLNRIMNALLTVAKDGVSRRFVELMSMTSYTALEEKLRVLYKVCWMDSVCLT